MSNFRLLITAVACAGPIACLAADPSLVRGFVAGCIDGQERAAGHPLSNDEKRSILNFCYCRAPMLAELLHDEKARQKFVSRDPATISAVARIDDNCMDAVKRGRRFYPSNPQ